MTRFRKLLLGTILGALAAFALSTTLLSAPPAHAATVAPVGNFGSLTIAATTATLIPASLSGRKTLGIFNYDTADLFCGWDAAGLTVDNTTGWVILAKTSASFDIGFAPNISGYLYCYSVSGTASKAVRWMEIR
jgi:hypothetical protein